MQETTQRLPAILLLGPTGVGKTPLGNWLDRHGLWGRRCSHFDFGAQLRRIAASGPGGEFSSGEIDFLNKVLAEGALLEKESFYLAAKILEAFVAEHGLTPVHWLVLNGLPRHLGQAEALSARLQVQAIIQLECKPEIIWERLRRDTGGDRASRLDDTPELIARKLAAYEERTRPLVHYYRSQGARLLQVQIGLTTQPAEIVQSIGEYQKPAGVESSCI